MKMKYLQAGAELCQAQDKLEVVVEVELNLELTLKLKLKLVTTSPGG